MAEASHPELVRAAKPIINDRGNGQGCEPRYATSVTSTPTSSRISLTTVASSDSPASTNPASTDTLPAGQTV